MVTTKDLREMGQNGVTLEDLRRLYGVNVTLEDLELALPSLLIDSLGLLPSRKDVTQSLFVYQVEHQDVEADEMIQSQDGMDKQMSSSHMVSKEHVYLSYTVNEDEMGHIQDEHVEQVISATQVDKSEVALPLSSQQQATNEVEAVVPSYYDPLLDTVSWHSLLALYLFSQSSNALDILMSLEILSRLV